MVVLSLFDGIACGYEALKRAGIEVDTYYASEIDKYAIQIATKNHPDIIELGDINNWKNWDIKKPDLILAGSPCQGFSVGGKGLAFDDPRSKLFFVFVDILRHYNPKYFLLENVKMKKEWIDIISKQLGVEPVLINSALVSAQNRQRLYWCNWSVNQPEDKHIMLKDIVHEYEAIGVLKNNGSYYIKEDKAKCLDANYAKGVDNRGMRTMIMQQLKPYIVSVDKANIIMQSEVARHKIDYIGKDSQANRIYSIHGKAVTLLGSAGGGAVKMGQYLFGCISPERVKKQQNGPRFNNGLKANTLTTVDRHGVLLNGYIRKLTPVECERLQTLPDGYTEGVSDTQRYKMLGNGWTVDVIAHILRCIKD
ncbi:MAG TPA: DNA (cytosine-5-)-methyltransferase [Candidatus Pacearchaeota archaeon]|nr:DNA (cytosine-5-)-methyltransferase [Candidatus Pacearchaeota archaeon]HOS12867.1 DNA (cytosine-5-)-methyltransferase [Candidatus Pacearchaeota archaeon]